VASADVAALASDIAEVASLAITIGDRLQQRLRVQEEPARAAQALAQLLSRDLADWPPNSWLVIDDYQHLSESGAAEEFIDGLVTDSPVNLFITTRERPAWVTAKRVASGDVLEISRTQLAMTDTEAVALLAGSDPSQTRRLVERANGWPALIALAGASSAFELPDAAVSETLYRFLAEEVVRHLPLRVQEFLMEASVRASVREVGDRDTAADHITDAIITLESQGLLFRVGEELRLHPLLREFLRQKLEREQPEEARRLYRLALALAVSEEVWDEAYELATHLRSYDAVHEIIEQASPRLLADGRLETVERWLRDLPVAYRNDPDLRLVGAEVALRRGEFSSGLALAEKLVEDPPEGPRPWLVAGRAAHLLAREEQALRYYVRAREEATSTQDRRDACWGALITAGVLELDEAEAYFAELESVAMDDIDSRLLVAVGRETVGSLQGTFAAAIPGIEHVFKLSHHSRDPMVRTNALSSTGWLSVLGAEYSRAQTIATHALDYCETLHLSFATPFFLAIRGAAEIGMRQLGRARGTLEQMTRMPAWAEDPFLQTDFSNLCTKLALTAGDDVRSIGELPFSHGHRSVLGERYCYLALVEIAAGRAARALPLLEAASQVSRATPVLFAAKWVSVLLDAVSPSVDEAAVTRRASDLLIESADAGCLDAFVYAYRSRPELLRITAADPRVSRLLAEVVRRAHDFALAKLSGAAFPNASPQSLRLTSREREVFALVREGASNSEIAAQLFISRSTAKVHVRNILKKLGVESRIAAARIESSAAD